MGYKANIQFKTDRLSEWLKSNELMVKSSLYDIVLNICDVWENKLRELRTLLIQDKKINANYVVSAILLET